MQASKILKVITAFNADYAKLAEINMQSIKKFCDFHGFEFRIDFITAQYPKPASWYKIDLLIHEINKAEADYILWIDTDTLIHNSQYDIVSEIIMQHPQEHIFLAKDHTDFNCGVMMVKCSEFSKDFLTKVSSMNEYLTHCWWEQAAIIDLYNQNYMNCQEKFKQLPQRLFNSYMYELIDDVQDKNQSGQFNKDFSFILHFPGISYDKKQHFMQHYLD
jgi:hypothetical protein